MLYRIIPIILIATFFCCNSWSYTIDNFNYYMHYDYSELWYVSYEDEYWYETNYWGDIIDMGSPIYISPEEGDSTSGFIPIEVTYYFKHELTINLEDNFQYAPDVFPSPPDPNPFIISYSEILSAPIGEGFFVYNEYIPSPCLYYEFLSYPPVIDPNKGGRAIILDERSSWIEVDFAQVPEPTVFILLITGLGAIGLVVNRRQ